MTCDGNGDFRPCDPWMSGCCIIDGEVCKLRLFNQGGLLLDHVMRTVGPVDPEHAHRRIMCSVALKIDQSLPEEEFKAAWAAHPDYQPVADHFAATNRSRTTCQDYGPGDWIPGPRFGNQPPPGRCCWRED